MITKLINKINPFKKELCLDSHNWHLEYTRGYKSLFFNWRPETLALGFWLSINKNGIEFSISIWWTLHGYYIWNKKLKHRLIKGEQDAIND